MKSVVVSGGVGEMMTNEAVDRDFMFLFISCFLVLCCDRLIICHFRWITIIDASYGI